MARSITEKEVEAIRRIDRPDLSAEDLAAATGWSKATINRIRGGYLQLDKKKKPQIMQPMTREESDRAVYPVEDEPELLKKLEKMRMSQVQTNYLLDLIAQKLEELLKEIK